MLETNLDQKFVFKKKLEDFFETKSWTKNIFSREKNLKNFFKKVTFFNDKSMKKSDIFSSKNDFFLRIFDFHIFSKIKFSSEKNVSEKVFGFYFYIISRAQPTQVASRNSPCAAHNRAKRIPENPKIRIWTNCGDLWLSTLKSKLIIRPPFGQNKFYFVQVCIALTFLFFKVSRQKFQKFFIYRCYCDCRGLFEKFGLEGV